MADFSFAAPPTSLPEHSPRVSSRLANKIERAKRHQIDSEENLTVIFEGTLPPEILQRIHAVGGSTRFSNRHGYELLLSARVLADLLPFLPKEGLLRLPFPHEAHVTTEGAEMTGALDMQNIGNEGSGVSIGIIDLGFYNLATSQAAGELPTTLTITDYTGTGTGGIDHGTNVAEIVHDIAPGAELFLAKINSLVQMDQAVTDMIAAGVDIINHSVGWYGAAFYDGTGDVCDISNMASNNGLLWVNSMGNSRYKHYQGIFMDLDNNLRHEFSTGQNYNTISINAGVTLTLILNWDDYASVSTDYDLFLYDGNPDTGGVIVASSINDQGTTRNKFPYPYESIDYTAPATAVYYVVISKENSEMADLPLALFSIGPDLGIKTYARSLTQPADCAGVLAVGATKVSDDTPEYFSSEGPTTDGRPKPEISGPDRVTTSLSASFAGTSASSPHVAGAAALVLSENPGLSATSLQALLIQTAEDVSVSGFDMRTGYGRLSLDADNDDLNHDHDNCVLDANPDQLDTDIDGAGDTCDEDDDNDGLPDLFELAIDTNPLLSDSDGDLLDDFFEISFDGDYTTYIPGNDLNPIISDTDGDGLNDYEEIGFDGNYSSYIPDVDLNPLSNDSDGDGFSDYSDPLPLTFHFLDGDIAPAGNPDGIVNAADYTMALRILLTPMNIPDEILSHADLYPVEGPDGVFSLADTVRLMQLLN